MTDDEFLVVTETDLLVEKDTTLEQIEVSTTEVLIETTHEIVEVTATEVLIEEIEPTLELLDATEESEMVEVGMQGPPGPPGDAPTITFPASAILSGHRAVRVSAGKVVYADAADLGDANLVLGISRNAAIEDDPVLIQTAGLMTEPSWDWTPDLPIFCGPAGALTQTAPTSGFDLILAIALTSTQIHIGAKMPIALI